MKDWCTYSTKVQQTANRRNCVTKVCRLSWQPSTLHPPPSPLPLPSFPSFFTLTEGIYPQNTSAAAAKSFWPIFWPVRLKIRTPRCIADGWLSSVFCMSSLTYTLQLNKNILLRQHSGFESRHLSKLVNGRHDSRRGQRSSQPKIYQKYTLWNILRFWQNVNMVFEFGIPFSGKFGCRFADGNIFFFPFVLCGLNFGGLATLQKIWQNLFDAGWSKNQNRIQSENLSVFKVTVTAELFSGIFLVYIGPSPVPIYIMWRRGPMISTQKLFCVTKEPNWELKKVLAHPKKHGKGPLNSR